MKSIGYIFLMLFVLYGNAQTNLENEVFGEEKKWVLALASDFENLKPITVTASVCERSVDGENEFYSEGDYWWPVTDNPNGPYIRKDSMTNPENFT